jgi:hypothetical protein
MGRRLTSACSWRTLAQASAAASGAPSFGPQGARLHSGDLAKEKRQPKAWMRKEPAVNGKVEEELIGLANEWDRAMVENDVEAIGRYMADDWTIIAPMAALATSQPFWD